LLVKKCYCNSVEQNILPQIKALLYSVSHSLRNPAFL